MIIRKARIKDIDGIIPVFKDYEAASVGYLLPKYRCMRNKKKPLDKHIKLALAADIKQKNSLFLVAEEEKKIVGYIFGQIRDNRHPLFDRPKTGELSDIAVLKSHKGKGISGKLWRELLAWFGKKNCEMITWSVNLNNPAQEIYKHWGFETYYLRMIRRR